MNKKILIFSIFFLILLSTNVFAENHIYNSTTSGIDFWAYAANTSAGNDGPPTDPWTWDGEFSPQQYTDISDSEDNRAVTGGGGPGENPAHTFTFLINEDISTISKIEFYWEGHGDNGDENFYYWNWTSTANWALISSGVGGGTDVVLTGSNTTALDDPANIYVNSSGYLHLVAVDEANKNANFRTDFVYINVTYIEVDSTPPTYSKNTTNTTNPGQPCNFSWNGMTM